MKLGSSFLVLIKESYVFFLDANRASRLQVFCLISEIYDCGVEYADPSPQNVCAGANGKDLRIIDFDGCSTFTEDSGARAADVFSYKLDLLKRLEVFDQYFGKISRPSAQQLDHVLEQVGLLIDHQHPSKLDSQRDDSVVSSITPLKTNSKSGTRKRRFSSSS